MNSSFEIEKSPSGRLMLYRVDDPIDNRIHFERTEVSDLVHQLMFYLPTNEGF